MRHLLIFAVLVSLTGAANAVTVDEFIKNLPPDTIASSKRVKPYLNTSTGSKLALFRAANPWTAAVTVGGLAASIAFEDELNQPLYDLFVGPDPIPDPEGVTGGDDGTHVQGEVWGTGTFFRHTATDFCHDLAAATDKTVVGVNVSGTSVHCVAHQNSNWYRNDMWGSRQVCGATGTAETCATTYTPPPSTWPADGKATGTVQNGTIADYALDPDATAFGGQNQIFFHTPDGIMKINVDSNGNLTVQEYASSPDPVTGETGTKIEGIKVDPVTGTVLDKWEKYQPKMTPVEAIGGSPVEGSTPSVQVQFPDSMNVNVNEDGTPPPENPVDSNYGGTGFDQLEAGFQVADPPSLNPLPDMPGYSATCQTITLNWQGHSVVFPDAGQCSKLGTAKTLIGWFLYIITGWLIAMAVLDNRRAA